MSKNANDDRIQEIEKELAVQREQIETSKRALEGLDPDGLADIGSREGGRIKNAEEAIARLEAELRSLQGK